MIAYVPLLVMLLGLLLWLLASNPKLQEIGKILFFCGALIATAGLSGKSVKLL